MMDNDTLFSKWIAFVSKMFGLFVRGKNGNSLRVGKSFFWKTKCEMRGKGNALLIGDNCYFKHCSFSFSGNDNRIEIKDGSRFTDTSFWIEDDGNVIVIGKNNHFCGLCQIAVIEGTSVTIGDECLISSNVFFRTGDSHVIKNASGERINHSKDIFFGNHIWVGTGVHVLKNAFVNDGCIIGACSLVNKRITEKNCVIAGNPAAIKKEQIFWYPERS